MNRKGFTLIELMMSIALFSIISIAIFSISNNVLSESINYNDYKEFTGKISVISKFITHDLEVSHNVLVNEKGFTIGDNVYSYEDKNLKISSPNNSDIDIEIEDFSVIALDNNLEVSLTDKTNNKVKLKYHTKDSFTKGRGIYE